MKENTHAIIHDVRLLEAIYNDLKDRFEEKNFDELQIKIGENSKVLFCNRYGVIGLTRFVPRRSRPVEIEDFYRPEMHEEKDTTSIEEDEQIAEDNSDNGESTMEDNVDMYKADDDNSSDEETNEEKESTEDINNEEESPEEELKDEESTEDLNNEDQESLEDEEESSVEEENESNEDENTEEEIITENKTINKNMEDNTFNNQNQRDSRRIRIDTLLENASVEVDPVVLTKIIKAVDIDYEHGNDTDSFLPNILKYVEDCKTY